MSVYSVLKPKLWHWHRGKVRVDGPGTTQLVGSRATK